MDGKLCDYKTSVDQNGEHDEAEDREGAEEAELVNHAQRRVPGVLREHVLVVQENR